MPSCKRVDYDDFYPCDYQRPQDFSLPQTRIAFPVFHYHQLPKFPYRFGQLGASRPFLFRILRFIVQPPYQNPWKPMYDNTYLACQLRRLDEVGG